MTIGIALNKIQLDIDMGDTVLLLAKFLRSVDQLHETFLLHADADFTAIGYTAAEVATLKSAWNNDGPLLAAIVRGTANLAVAQDFRANMFQMAGTGLQ